MFRFAYRQRRRILFFMLCIILTGFLQNGFEAYVPSGMLWLDIVAFSLAILIMTIAVALVFLTLITFAPILRNIAEIFGFITLSFTGLDRLTTMVLGENSDYWFVPFIPLAWLMFILVFFCSSLFDSILPHISQKCTRRFYSPKSAEDIWYNLAPGKAPVEHHWDSLLREIESDPNDPNTFMATYTAEGGLTQHVKIKYVVDKPFTHFKYEFSGEQSQKYASYMRGTYEVVIQLRPTGGCTVSLTEHFNALFFRHALLFWFDDDLGSQADHLYALHNGKRDWSLVGKYRRKINKMV